MPLEIIFLGLLLPFAGLTICVVKSYKVWRGKLRGLSRNGKLVAIGVVMAAVAFGGGKGPVGPTLANLKLLIAERGGKLSNGQSYGEKSAVVSAGALTSFATNATAETLESIAGTSNTVAAAAQSLEEAVAVERHYLRLSFPSPLPEAESNLYGEILRCTATNGVASAHVWFNVAPNADPQMCLTFSLGSATNSISTVAASSSSYPNTVVVDGRDCYQYTFQVPVPLLRDGQLFAPLDVEKRISLGCSAMSVPFNVDGGIALYANGQYYVGVTGWRTNTVSGIAYYFYNGLLGTPPMEMLDNAELE